MGREADTPFRQRQSERCLHRSAKPGIGVRIAWPISFIHTAKNEKVRILQTRLQRPPNVQPRMPSIAGTHDTTGHQRRQQSRVEFGINRPKNGGRLVQFADELGQGFTGFFRPKFRFAVGRRIGG